MYPGATTTEPLRVAVVGCGLWGRNIVRTLGDLGALAAVVDADPAVASECAAQHDVAVMTLADVLVSDIHAVAIATPAVTHGTLAREALRAGKAVFVEKPIALDVAEATELCELAETSGQVLMVGHLMQYHPAFQAMEDLAGKGDLGRLLYVYSNRLNFGRFRREENILWSFAPHDVSMMLRLVGDLPAEVTAVRSTFLQEVTADVTTTHLTFPGGVRGHIFVSWLHPFKEQKLVVVGDQGMAVFDDGEPWDRKLALYRHRVAWTGDVPEPDRAEVEYLPIEQAEPLRVEMAHFLACVAAGSTPRTDGREGLRVLQVLDAAERSMRRAAPVSPEGGRAGVHTTAVVDDDVVIGAGTRIWHFSHVLGGSRLGADCSIGQNVMIGPNVSVGDRCKIQNNVSVYDGVTLEDDVFCGPSCVFTNVRTPRANVDRRGDFLPTLVREGASIGANATIVCGTTIGRWAMVGAGAVVTADVPDHALVVGLPARRVGWVSHDGEVLGDDLTCPRTGRRYLEEDGVLRAIE